MYRIEGADGSHKAHTHHIPPQHQARPDQAPRAAGTAAAAAAAAPPPAGEM